MSKLEDLTGQKFGRLTVLGRVQNKIQQNGRRRTYWDCKCECGNTVQIAKDSLKSGATKSCGCYQKERVTETHKKYNKYDLSGECGIGYTSNQNVFYFDLEDYDKIKDYCWGCDKNGYLVSAKTNTSTKIRMHRLLIDCPKNKAVDHINRKIWDNRKNNLRIVTTLENAQNRGIAVKNTSGCVGVFWRKDRNKWQAKINYMGVTYSLGSFANYEDAMKVRKGKEKEFGLI